MQIRLGCLNCTTIQEEVVGAGEAWSGDRDRGACPWGGLGGPGQTQAGGPGTLQESGMGQPPAKPERQGFR